MALGRRASNAVRPEAAPIICATAQATSLLSWTTVGLALLNAAFNLSRSRLPGAPVRATLTVLHPLHTIMGSRHSGLVSDYVTWIGVGLALMAGCVVFPSVF